tara:strand:+ start:678 stop:1100 length:423 start_codon:yes stop_codon:yes gene_type:complete
MADIGVGIRTYLLTKSTITDIVGTRIYPSALPQNADLPAIVYDVIGGRPDDVLTGSSGSYRASIDLDCISTNHITSNNLAEQVRLVTQGYFGAMGDEQVNASRLTGRFEQYLAPIDGSDLGRHVVALSFDITHNQTIPTY